MAEDAISTVKRSVRLSEYIGKFTKVKSAGGGHKYMAFCPLHDNTKTPAMSIDDQQGLWHCFAGCGGGSIIDFWMKKSGSEDFSEALEGIASECSITLPESNSQAISAKRIKTALTAVAQNAHYHLMKGSGDEVDATRAYLRSRGIGKRLAVNWLLGIMPEGKEATRFVVDAAHNDVDALVEGGLLKRNDSDGTLWCPFQGRLLFPIENDREETLGFGGRKIPGVSSWGDGKYINPSNSRVYNKSSQLYGGAFVTRRSDVVVVEGYLDVLAISDITEDLIPVAVCGTSFTAGHSEILQNSSSVTFLFDGDSAGSRALSSSIWVVNKLDENVYASQLPDGKDPFDLAMEEPETLLQSIDEAGPLITQSAEAKLSTTSSNQEFDSWVASSASVLIASSHKDQLIKSAAAIRKQSVSSYSRILASSNSRTSQRVTTDGEPSVTEALDANMASLAKRILQMNDDERDSVLAGLLRWTERSEQAVRSWLPVTSETDLAVLERAASGMMIEAPDPQIDRILSQLIPAPQDTPEDISTPLRNMITLMSHDATTLGLESASASLTNQILALRRINGSSKMIGRQPLVLAYLIDLAVDMERHRSKTSVSSEN